MKVYVYEIVTAIVLLGVVELYFWTQSTLTLDSTATKIILIALYVLIACLSQYSMSATRRYSIVAALKANALIGLVVSAGVTLLAFSVHQGVVKDASADFVSVATAFAKFLVTIGLATLCLRMVVAALVHPRDSGLPAR